MGEGDGEGDGEGEGERGRGKERGVKEREGEREGGGGRERGREEHNQIKVLNQRTVKSGGEIQDGSLRAQKILNELSSEAFEQTLIISGCFFRAFSQDR